MKTSEFIKKVKALDYGIIERSEGIDVVSSDGGRYRFAVVSKKEFKELVLFSGSFELAKLCIEYAETLFSEREEEKKYRVRIPDSPERTPVYALCKLVNGCVVINQTNENNFQEHDRYRLTEAEIKRNHEYLWQFAKEVEE